jgi:NhaA family Na+:H+ antiporter
VLAGSLLSALLGWLAFSLAPRPRDPHIPSQA